MKRTFAVLCTVILIGTLFAGCSQNKISTVSSKLPKGEVTYPIQSSDTLTYWMPLNINISATVSNFGDTLYAKELKKKTGIDVTYMHPAQGQEKEQFNIMIASGDLPDVIEYNWFSNFPGGPSKAVSNGYITALDDIYKEYAPNLTNYLSKNSEIAKMIKTDDGNYYVFPFIRQDDYLKVYSGLVIRNDWLKELKLEVPETIDEWENVLSEFKNKKGAIAPLSFGIGSLNAGPFIGAYDTITGFYLEKGTIKYGAMEKGYFELVKKLNDWYNKGLFDKNFATIDSKVLDSNILSGKSGATYGLLGSGIGKWINSGVKSDPKFDLVATKYPVLNKGDNIEFGQLDLSYIPSSGAAISNASKNKALAARLLDYVYSEEGQLLFNYGIEGESYVMKDNVPTYTDKITKNSEGLSMSSALSKYARSGSGGPGIQAKGYMVQYLQLPQQKAAIDIWKQTNMKQHLLPFLTPKSQESEEYSNIINNVKTYEIEMLYKFIMGTESLDDFPKFIQQLKDYGIEKAITIQQSAYERYNQR